jgi:hypothetical protein
MKYGRKGKRAHLTFGIKITMKNIALSILLSSFVRISPFVQPSM